MTDFRDLTASQLRRILAIKEEIEALHGRMEAIVAVGGGGKIPIPATAFTPVAATSAKRKLSATHRRKLVNSLAKARKIRQAKGTGATDSEPAKRKTRRSGPTGKSARETEVRETGRGLVEHLDQIGSEQGSAQLIQYLQDFRMHYREDGRGRGGGRGFRVKAGDPIDSDALPDWLKLAREQFPDLEEAIYSFADRHRDRVLRRHERTANINGLSNFIEVMVATSKVLFVYLRRGVLAQAQVTARLREYLNIFTGRIPEYRDEETTGYLARIYSNGNGRPESLQQTFEEHNVSGHLHALLLVAQVVRGSANGGDASNAESQLPMLVDQIKAFENRIGLGTATVAQLGRALAAYEMLTEQELGLWTKKLKPGEKAEQKPPPSGSGDGSAARNAIEQRRDGGHPNSGVSQDSGGLRDEIPAGGEGETQTDRSSVEGAENTPGKSHQTGHEEPGKQPSGQG